MADVQRSAVLSEDGLYRAPLVIAGWGTWPLKHGNLVMAWPSVWAHDHKRTIHALELTLAGCPKHPLYVKGDTKPIPWAAPREGAAK